MEQKEKEGKEYVVLFSSGRTSAFLAKYVKERYLFNETIAVFGTKGKAKYHYHQNEKGDKCIFLMMNTGKERKESLQFANKCDKEWGLKLIYLEAVVQKGRISTKHKIVNYSQLDQTGKPFEDMLKKYPLPNNMASNCTRELKQRPKESFLKSINWKNAFTFVGIRKDEEHRKSNTALGDRVIYPLCDDLQVDSLFIRNWWNQQKFDLQLKDYEGNCDLCFKKSVKKRLTIIKENPKVSNWWKKMENKYSSEEIPRFDLRSNISIEQLIELAKKPFKKTKKLI